MREEYILEAEIKVKSFLKALKDFQDNKSGYISKESGALKKSSMALTRALANLRKSN